MVGRTNLRPKELSRDMDTEKAQTCHILCQAYHSL